MKGPSPPLSPAPVSGAAPAAEPGRSAWPLWKRLALGYGWLLVALGVLMLGDVLQLRGNGDAPPDGAAVQLKLESFFKSYAPDEAVPPLRLPAAVPLDCDALPEAHQCARLERARRPVSVHGHHHPPHHGGAVRLGAAGRGGD